MNESQKIRAVQVMRYVMPLREGGSLPAIAEADDGFLYVLKFRGAGQGSRALIADFIGGEIARACGLNVPEMVFASLDESFGRTEPDPEIQGLLRASEGLNLGVHYLSGAITYDPAVNRIDEMLASRIVWLDAFLMNVDRTVRNTNMLSWRKELWLIDHGASLYFHHDIDSWEAQSVKPFTQIKDHVLLPQATKLEEVTYLMKEHINIQLVRDIVALIPDSWLPQNEEIATKKVYIDFLTGRLQHSNLFINEAIHAGKSHI